VPVDLDAVADELYGLRPEQFTAARNERVAAARTAGDRELAEQIGGLRRPSLSAWAGNLLVREQPDEVKPLIQLGEALRSAHHDLDGDQLRALAQQQRAVVRALSRQAGDLAAAAGHPLADDAQREVQETLQAVLADPDAAREWAAGRLAKPLSPAVGFPAVGPAAPSRGTGGQSAAKRTPSSAQKPSSPAKKPRASDDGESAAETRRRERLAQARQDSEDAEGDLLAREAEVETAERAVRDARERTDTLQQRISELTEELKAVEEQHRQARADERGARQREREAGRGVHAARTRAGTAAAQVERLVAKSSGKRRS
jgi:hypothetical protein